MMREASVFTVFFTGVAIPLAVLVQPALTTSVQLVLTRRDTNSVELTCRERDTTNVITDARFFRNATIPLQGRNGILDFTITTQDEGNYTCVNSLNTQSNSLQLVAYPDGALIPSPAPATYALVESRVLLNCPVSPGALRQQYTIMWFMGEQQNLIINSNSITPPLDRRYSIDPATLSLVIVNVALSDANDQYRCLLTVRDPQSGETRSYSTLSNVHIPLIVLEHPRITHPPTNKIGRLDEEVTFSCTARGNPLPDIIWMRENARIIADDTKYTIETESDEDSFTVSSELTLLSAQPLDSGVIQCVATPPSDAETGDTITLTTDRAEATLSVLGRFIDVEVRITVDRDVIFDLNLPTKLQDPVQLYLEYRNVDNSEMDTKTTSAMYTNLKNIRHIEFDSDVNFERFDVSVALESGGVRGPIMPAGRYDKSMPNTPLRELIRQIPVMVITAALLFFGIFFLIFIGIMVKKCYKWQHEFRMGEEKRASNVYNKTSRNTSLKSDDNPPTINYIVDEELGPTSGMAAGPPPLPSSTGNRIRRMMSRQKSKEYEVESGGKGQLSGGSLALTKFVANTLFKGLTDKDHGQKFKQIVDKVMEEARKTNPQACGGEAVNHVPTVHGPEDHVPQFDNPAYVPVGNADVDNKDISEAGLRRNA